MDLTFGAPGPSAESINTPTYNRSPAGAPPPKSKSKQRRTCSRKIKIVLYMHPNARPRKRTRCYVRLAKIHVRRQRFFFIIQLKSPGCVCDVADSTD